MNTKRILLADDHPVFRSGVVQIVRSLDSFDEILESSDGLEAWEIIKDAKPDYALLDIRMPGMTGIQILEKIEEESLPTRTILLTMHRNRNYFYRAVSLGVKGFLLKESALEEIFKAINEIIMGGTYISPQLESHKNSRSKIDIDLTIASINSLTQTERIVLKLISEWKSNQEIAEQLFVSPRTAGNHRTHIANKLHLKGTHGIIRFAIENADLF